MGCAGHQSAGLWTHPGDRSTSYTDLSYWTDLARLLERGGFDALFLADVLGVYDVHGGSRDTAVRAGAQVPLIDPMLTIPAMAAVTERLGFAVTSSVTYEHPWATARRFTTLDHLTNGRVGWNVVTSYLASAARGYGMGEQVPHDRRYDLAEEYVEVCAALWEGSWEDGAVVHDSASATFTDPSKVHDVDHDGEFFSVHGPFLCEPSPQRTPVVFQAGASARGLELGGRIAEVVFVSGPTTAAVRTMVDGVRAAAQAAGRDRGDIKVLTMLTPVLADTDDAAWAKHADYVAHSSREGAMALFGGWTGVDLSGLDPDAPLEHVENDATRTALAAFTTADPHAAWTVGSVAEFVAVGGRGPVLVGSPTTVADELERWCEEADVDGFNLAYATSPGTFTDVVDLLVPELRARGRILEPEGATLRERLVGGTARLSNSSWVGKHRK
ncbi:LLM class flavin-dependent oxidoreductase (plasmid) [Rhodococcus antarcticus]|uniref:LLM class flavin-dependent oxidoreductase n=1 Tax=Rhodococcus antarcticus TaxID=2987751 RepID=A0ABY6P5Y7_9NOCA|nr:LLM class flavin-dependent oxidoreductase [Rhodococcus antarcticus]UZJ26928.1 LLM class flavin-dependent oxidoreductase [Rhodococcus antarcticus]